MTLKRPIELVREPEGERKPLVFPLPSSEHGTAMVTCTVGARTKWPTRKFRVHKNLLCRASKYFNDAFHTSILDDPKTKLELPDDFPPAFEVLYQWLYTGFFYGEKLPMKGPPCDQDRYWFEVYAFANCRLIPHMKEHVINVFGRLFTAQEELVPSIALTERLTETGKWHDPLHDYIVGHVAFWHGRPSYKWQGKYDGYKDLFKACDGKLAQQVALRTAKWYKGSPGNRPRRHPLNEEAYKEARREAVRLGYATPGSCHSTETVKEEKSETDDEESSKTDNVANSGADSETDSEADSETDSEFIL